MSGLDKQILGLVKRFQTFTSKLFIFLFISLLIIFGSASVFRAPIIADDLRVLTKGLADLSETSNAGGLFQVVWLNIEASTGFHHIMPIAAIFEFFENLFVFSFLNLIPDPLYLFAILRSSWHVFALASMSLFLAGFVSQGKTTKFQNFIVLYVVCGIAFISVTQIHSAWKEAPIASYGLHGSGIAAIGFLYLNAIHLNSVNSAKSYPRILLAGLLGILGTFTYEMFVAPLLAGVVLYLYLKSKSENKYRYFFKNPETYSVFVPVGLYSLANLIRLLFPEKNYYDGTQIGDLSQVIPNFISGVYGSLPLTYLGTAVGQVGVQEIVLEKTIFYLVSVTLLILILYGFFAKGHFSGIEFSLQNRNFLRLILILLWLTSTLSFMFSAKYQRELGVGIGTVYIFYAVGNLAVIGVIAIWISGNNQFARVALLSTLMIVGVFTNTYNYSLVDKIKANTTVDSYTKMYSSLRDESLVNPKRCELLINLRASNLPEYYKSSLIQNFQIFYFNETGKPFCLINGS